MNSFNIDPSSKKDETKDAAEINKTDKNGAFDDSDGKSKNYKGGADTVNGPNMNEKSEDVDGDTGENAGIFK